MSRVRDRDGFSFEMLEELVWNEVAEVYRGALVATLEALDKRLEEDRDSERYVYKDRREREVLTRFGLVRIKRRYYWDREREDWVALLDEALGLDPYKRVSEGVRQRAVEAAVAGRSYRGAQEELARANREVVVSHEAIRQWTIRTGEYLAVEQARSVAAMSPTRQVPVLFVEVDGFWPGRQHGKRQEVRLVVVHEGWEERRRGSGEYRLKNRKERAFHSGEDLWEQVSDWLESEYDLSETWVVINGDRAGWIRAGVDHFKHALYQIDRFHLMRDLKRVLRPYPDALEAAQKAVEANNAKELLGILAAAMPLRKGSPKQRQELEKLYKDLVKIPEAIRDYRVRLKEKGVDTSGYQGVGAAEGAVERYSQRLRKVGRSWSACGLFAMVQVMVAYFAGTLRDAVQTMERSAGLKPSFAGVQEQATKRAVSAVLEEVRITQGRFPALERGTNATGGLSRVLRSIARGTPEPRAI